MKVRMFVAAFMPDQAFVIFADSVVCADVHATSPHVDDVMGGYDGRYPSSDGLWIWEGNRAEDSEYGDAKYSAGAWRRPTDDEARAAAGGDNPLNGDCGP